MTAHQTASGLCRWEKALVGERLVPVAHEAEATHVELGRAREHIAAHAQRAAALETEVERLRQCLQTLDTQLAEAVAAAERAETRASQQQHESEHLAASVQRLARKNADLIGEKRRLRDLLVAKHPRVRPKIVHSGRTG